MIDVSSRDQVFRIYETLFLDSPDAIALCDMNQVVVKVNPAFTELFGFSEYETVGRLLETLITPTPEMKAESDRLTARIAVREKVFTQTTRARKDGTVVPVSILGLTYRISANESLMFWNYRDISALVAAKRQVNEIERRFKVIFHNSPHPIFALDRDSLLTYMNPAMDDLFDLPGYKLVGLPLREITGPEEREEAVLKFSECAKGKIVSMEFNFADAKGIEKRGIVRAFPIQDADGEFDGVVCFMEDITERWQAEAELRQEKSKHKAMFELDPIPRFLLDSSKVRDMIETLKAYGIRDFLAYSDTHPAFIDECYGLIEIVDMNQAAMERFAISEKASLLGPVSLLSDKNRNPACMKRIIKAIAAEEEQFTYEDTKFPMHPEGSSPLHLLNTWTATRNADGLSSLFFLSMQDITPIKEAQLRTEESERQYRMLFENAGEGILAVDEQANIRIANPALEKMLGVGPRGMEGKSLFDFIDPSMASVARASFDRGKLGIPDSLELHLAHRDGTLIPVHVKATPVLDSKGNYLAGIGLFEDLRKIRHAESELRKQSALLRRVWHQTIRALSSTVERRDPYTAGHQRRVQKLALAISRKLRLEPGRRAGLNIAAIVHDIGKISIPAEILTKPGQLSSVEMQLIRTHPQTGFEILKAIEFPWPVAEIVCQHHEAFDGSGYPRGLSGEQILLEARIIGVADMVEATSSDRPYRPALGLGPALDQLRELRGTKYDPEVVDICLEVFSTGFSWET